MLIYSIKNEKLEFFNRPIYCESSNEALSYLQNVLMSDADRALIGLKDDLALYCLGSVDFVSGKIDAFKKPQLITTLASIFDTIPADRVPQTANQLRESISKLRDEIGALRSNVEVKEGE